MSQEDNKLVSVRHISLVPGEDKDGNDKMLVCFNKVVVGHVTPAGSGWAVYAHGRPARVTTMPTVFQAVDELRKHLTEENAV